MDGRIFSLFYRTWSPKGAVAQKLDLGLNAGAPTDRVHIESVRIKDKHGSSHRQSFKDKGSMRLPSLRKHPGCNSIRVFVGPLVTRRFLTEENASIMLD